MSDAAGRIEQAWAQADRLAELAVSLEAKLLRVRALQRKWATTPGMAELADDLEVAIEGNDQ